MFILCLIVIPSFLYKESSFVLFTTCEYSAHGTLSVLCICTSLHWHTHVWVQAGQDPFLADKEESPLCSSCVPLPASCVTFGWRQSGCFAGDVGWRRKPCINRCVVPQESGRETPSSTRASSVNGTDDEKASHGGSAEAQLKSENDKLKIALAQRWSSFNTLIASRWCAVIIWWLMVLVEIIRM